MVSELDSHACDESGAQSEANGISVHSRSPTPGLATRARLTQSHLQHAATRVQINDASCHNTANSGVVRSRSGWPLGTIHSSLVGSPQPENCSHLDYCILIAASLLVTGSFVRQCLESELSRNQLRPPSPSRVHSPLKSP